ncbi:MAG: bifunctional diaminohydroxyphosphoribosylaminopyrimidine deaminase/5-amino-6-(5-phosphoribosylamino)uracil reductase RibD [Cognatishimia sp.]|nr:bifunctional diaminohydroxyphosphoribosylaminopyrimidine deaminase/5-amino-6-(5-phosphoribosylamino)uracil reductase RibD [Cognatishimia sp.]
MALALTLGRRGQGFCWPNPAVGCVIVKDGRIVGRGTTAPGGRPHAEPQALAQAGAAALGATAYVTLEPCSHYGKTPPCAEALIKAGVARVVVALKDNDPRVSGRGLQMLTDAGIEVTTGVLAEQAAWDLKGFFLKTDEGRPFVTLKLAMTLDGRIATATGESKWITGPEARRRVHAQRANHDAILVGGGTARADDPSLTVRDMGITNQPVRVVASRRLDLSPDSTLARTARDVPVWLLHGPDVQADAAKAWQKAGAKLIPCDLRGAQLDPASLLRTLGAQGLTRVYCEGGGSLAASLLQAGLVDQLIVFTAGLALGAEGHPGIGALGVQAMSEAPRLQLVAQDRVGQDIMSVWRRP